jgi:hypothetical protein
MLWTVILVLLILALIGGGFPGWGPWSRLPAWLRVALISLSVLLGGTACVTPDSEFVSTWVRDLEARGVQSCLYYEGHGGPYVSIRGVTATGGATLEECFARR